MLSFVWAVQTIAAVNLIDYNRFYKKIKSTQSSAFKMIPLELSFIYFFPMPYIDDNNFNFFILDIS